MHPLCVCVVYYNIERAGLPDYIEMWEWPADKTTPNTYLSIQTLSLSLSLTLSHVYRGAGGYWRKYDATQLATPEAFMANPSLVWEFYSHRREVASTKVYVFII